MKLYRNTGSHASPTWVIIDEIGDVSIPDLKRGVAELKRRANEFAKNLASLIQVIALEFRFHHGLDATGFTVLRNMFFNGTVLEFACMDGDIAEEGSEGLILPALLEDFPWDQPLEDVSGHDIRLSVSYWESPAGTEIDPSWLVVEEA